MRQSLKRDAQTYDESAMKDDEIEVLVQINGKTKAVVGGLRLIFQKKMRSQREKRQLRIN